MDVAQLVVNGAECGLVLETEEGHPPVRGSSVPGGRIEGPELGPPDPGRRLITRLFRFREQSRDLVETAVDTGFEQTAIDEVAKRRRQFRLGRLNGVTLDLRFTEVLD